MKILVALIGFFLVGILLTFLVHKKINTVFSGNFALACMLLFTAMGHFMFPSGMAMMIPEIIPFKMALVYLTGIIEILTAIGLFMPGTRKLTGWFLICFFILILPVNINAALNHVQYETATLNGPGLTYLWFRIPLQILFICWVYYFAIKRGEYHKGVIEE